MNIGSHIRTAVLAPLVFALVGCVSPTDCCSDPESAGETVAPTSDAERLAMALVEADNAFARGDRERLTDALRRFDALGGKPLDDNAPDVERWRQAASQTPPNRGRPLGPGYRIGQLLPGGSDQMEQVFLSGKRASVALSAPGNVRLKLEVKDRSAEAVCGKEGNPSHCQWVPLFTDRYRIKVANPGKTAVRYFLVVE